MPGEIRSRQIIVQRRRQGLGQVAPSATTETDLYTCPKKYLASGQVMICERGGAAATFRVALRAAGTALSGHPEFYLAYGEALSANARAVIEGIELAGDDILTVYASTADLTFAFVGEEHPDDLS